MLSDLYSFFQAEERTVSQHQCEKMIMTSTIHAWGSVLGLIIDACIVLVKDKHFLQSFMIIEEG